jgi:hypothetical protein
MAKNLVQTYTFNTVTNTVKLPEAYATNQLLLITNVTRNEIIYNFADPTLGATSTFNNITVTGASLTFQTSTNVVTFATTASIGKAGSGWTLNSTYVAGGSAEVLGVDITDRKLYISKIPTANVTSSAGTLVSTEPNRLETTVSLTYNTGAAGHQSSDKLQIFVDTGDSDFQKMNFPDRMVDPVEKLRVSQPQSMIDTDFEYGVQPGRWESLIEVCNYPSTFPKGVGTKTNTLEWQGYAARDERGFNVLDIYSIQCGASSKTATVHCRSGHGLNIGDIVYIRGGFDPNDAVNNHFFVQSITNISFTIRTLGANNFNGGTATSALPAPGLAGVSATYGSANGLSFAAADNSINRTSGSFLTDGFRTGQRLVVTGSRAGNNAVYLVTAVTTLKITLDTRNIVANETPSGYTPNLASFAVVQSFGCYNSTELPGVSSVRGDGSTTVTVTTNVNHGLAVGQAVVMQNANSAPANGVFFIATTPTNDSFTYTAYGTVTNGDIFQAQIYVPNVLPCVVTGNGSNSVVTITTISPAVHGFAVGHTPSLRIVNAPSSYASVFGTATITGNNTMTYVAETTVGSGAFTAAVFFQASGNTTHVPFSGGCSMTTNTTSAFESISRQTRRYFRYQSGKGYQVSFGVRMKNTGSASSGVRTRAGHFDSQNGVFIEHDGTNTYFVRRNSTTLLAGSIAVTLGSQVVTGAGTSFTDPNSGVGVVDNSNPTFVVIRGGSYQVLAVTSDSQMIISPAYRGSTELGGVNIAKTVDYRIPQSSWNLDPCDGTGSSAFNYDPTKMNMVYMDWHWYGAGNVRFGFKNRKGEIFYAHKLVHSNVVTSAFFRSGNLPLRYQVTTGPTGAQGGSAPFLLHWGTSAIMDGRFDDDRGFTFCINNVRKTVGQISLTTTVSGSTTFDPTDNSLTIGGSGDFTSISYGAAEGGKTGPVQIGAILLVSGSTSNNGLYTVAGVQNKKLYLSGKQVITETIAAPTLQIGRLVALANLRQAPGVENSQAGTFGGRDLQNRMQLLPLGLDIINDNASTIEIRGNPTLVGQKWQPVGSGSLAQYDASATDIIGGEITFASSSQDPATAGKFSVSTFDLRNVRELNNSILGGDRTWPDGPDVYSVVVKTNPATASTTSDVTFRWIEQQS